MPTDIVLTTMNSKYHHCSFGLRYLYANLGNELRPRTRIEEHTIQVGAREIVESLLAHRPRIIGFGVYIWNVELTLQVVSILKRLSPETIIVLGGPEVTHESESQRICSVADYTIRGEGDFLFRELCHRILVEGDRPASKFISGPLPDVTKIESPYAYYTDDDIRNRTLYVEASRGCPFKCEYCLSSLDVSVRNFPLEPFLADMAKLIERGARQLKFVDRTFNLSIPISTRILGFFLGHAKDGVFPHFEMVPDRLPPELRDLIMRFPPGALQFEVGIQTWNPDVARRISRRQDYARIVENFQFLKERTGVHLHADLIAGLPGEDLESFAKSFDAVAALEPHEIQVGILKRLRGTPIVRHDAEWEMTYQEHPPYLLLRNRQLDFVTLQAIGRFSRYWDLIANSGNFGATMRLFEEACRARENASLFHGFMQLTEFLSTRHPQTHGIALLNLARSVWDYMTERMGLDPGRVSEALTQDYSHGAIRRDVPAFLRNGGAPAARPVTGEPTSTAPDRQRRHWANRTSKM